MIPTAEQVKPKFRGKSDFFSWQLYRYMREYKNPSERRIWAATWNNCYGLQPDKPSLYIGSERDGYWIHARQLRNLCLKNQKIERYAYGAPHDTANWVDVTDAFWSDYLKIGVCAIHGDYAHKWQEEGGLRTCEYCGKKERKQIVMVEKEVWRAAQPLNDGLCLMVSFIMPHLNPATRTPPVGCPLLIRLPTGRLVQVERRQWATSHNEPLEFHGKGIGYWGRYEWTYP